MWTTLFQDMRALIHSRHSSLTPWHVNSYYHCSDEQYQTHRFPYCLTNSRIAANIHGRIVDLHQYTTDFASSDYFFLMKLKDKALSDNNVGTASKNWLNGQGYYFFQAVLNKLVLLSDKCLDRFDDLVGKVIRKYILIQFCIFYLLLINDFLLLL